MRHALLRNIPLLGAVVGALLARPAIPVASQTATEPWTPPVNVSASGAASQPVLAAAPDGTLHALWWDAVANE